MMPSLPGHACGVVSRNRDARPQPSRRLAARVARRAAAAAALATLPVTALPLTALHAQASSDTTRLAAIVVTADRLARPIGSTTASVTVIDGATLRAAGIAQLGDALRAVPGVSIAQAGSNGSQASIFLRGGESDYVRLLVDGVPMNDPGGAIDLGALTLDNVERIEIVRGPASVLYGSDAVTGVVQVFTRRAAAPFEARLAARGGSYGTRAADASIGTRGAIGSLSLGLAHHASDGILAFNNAYRNDVASLRGETRVASVRSVLSLRHSDNTFHYPTDGAGAVVDRNAWRGERRSSASAEFSRALGARVEGIVSLSALDVHGRTNDPADDASDTVGFHAYRSVGTVRRRGADARVVIRPAAGHALSLGGEYAGERQRSADSSNYDVSLNRFAAGRITRALYAQWVGDVGRASFTAGGRYDDNETYGVFRTARAGAAVRLWPGARLRAAVGTGFKAPTFLETFSSAFSIGNPALTPERSRSREAGVEQSLWGDRVQLAATAFDQRFRDLIQYTWTSPTAPNYFNVAAASARGVEIEARGEVARGVAVFANATALRTRVDDAGFQSGAGATFVRGERLLRRPPLTLAAGAQLHRFSRTRLDLSVLRVGPRDDRDFATYPATPVRLESYTRVDLGGEVELGHHSEGWRTPALTLRIENAFGARYQEVVGFAAPGRVLLAGFRLGTLR